MLDHDELLERTLTDRLVAIIWLRHDALLARVAEALVTGGIRALEFTLTSPGVIPTITACRTRFRDDVIVGAGTVLDAEEARRCLDAGAQFLVSPGFDPAVVALARERGALAMPGALTPTEIVTAWRAGADVVKVFPARVRPALHRRSPGALAAGPAHADGRRGRDERGRLSARGRRRRRGRRDVGGRGCRRAYQLGRTDRTHAGPGRGCPTGGRPSLTAWTARQWASMLRCARDDSTPDRAGCGGQIDLMDCYAGRLSTRDSDVAVPTPSVEQRTAAARASGERQS